MVAKSSVLAVSFAACSVQEVRLRRSQAKRAHLSQHELLLGVMVRRGIRVVWPDSPTVVIVL